MEGLLNSMNSGTDHRRRWFVSRWFIPRFPLLLCLLIMLPRLLSPQYGLFDDGRTIQTAHNLSQGIWDLRADSDQGRFRPVYWLLYTLPYLLFGPNPFWPFLANTLLFIFTTEVLMRLARRAGGGEFAAGAVGCLFALSGPTIENYYTLSKGEAVQLFWLALSLLSISHASDRSPKESLYRGTLLSAVFLLLACLSKETALILAPISLAWLTLLWLGRKILRWRAPQTLFLSAGAYFLASLLAALVFVGWRAAVVGKSLTGGSYSNHYDLSLQRIIDSLWWRHWWMQDFAYLIPLLLFVLVWYLFLSQRAGIPPRYPELRHSSSAVVCTAALVWMFGWIALYLPWAYALEYYMLPLGAGVAFLAGFVLDLYREIRTKVKVFPAAEIGRSLPAIGRSLPAFIALTTLAAFVFLLTVTLLNNATNAQIQLAVDAANAEMLDYVSQNAPLNSVVLLNIQYPNEYVEQIALHFHIARQRPDLKVETFAFQELTPGVQYFVLAPQIAGRPVLTVRLGVFEGVQDQWNGSLVPYFAQWSTVETDEEIKWPVAFTTQHQFQETGIDVPRALCALKWSNSYCEGDRSALNWGTFSYAWTIYASPAPYRQ